MKRIRKGPEPPALTAFNATLPRRGPRPDWTDARANAAKLAVRLQTKNDQLSVCCYCTATIGHDAYHIEHFRPRRVPFRALTFEWRNLLASCESYRREEISGVPVPSQLHCGHRKGSWFEPGVTVDPQSANVETLFRFPLSGKIAPNKSLPTARYAAVQTTINQLNLNAPSLVARRSNLLTKAVADMEQMSRGDWHRRYLDVPAEGTIQEFWPALAHTYRTLQHEFWDAAGRPLPRGV